MKNDFIGLIFECPIHLDEKECPFKKFRVEKDAIERVGMWESMDSTDFSYKLRFHELCFAKNEP